MVKNTTQGTFSPSGRPKWEDLSKSEQEQILGPHGHPTEDRIVYICPVETCRRHYAYDTSLNTHIRKVHLNLHAPLSTHNAKVEQILRQNEEAFGIAPPTEDLYERDMILQLIPGVKNIVDRRLLRLQRERPQQAAAAEQPAPSATRTESLDEDASEGFGPATGEAVRLIIRPPAPLPTLDPRQETAPPPPSATPTTPRPSKIRRQATIGTANSTKKPQRFQPIGRHQARNIVVSTSQPTQPTSSSKAPVIRGQRSISKPIGRKIPEGSQGKTKDKTDFDTSSEDEVIVIDDDDHPGN